MRLSQRYTGACLVQKSFTLSATVHFPTAIILTYILRKLLFNNLMLLGKIQGTIQLCQCIYNLQMVVIQIVFEERILFQFKISLMYSKDILVFSKLISYSKYSFSNSFKVLIQDREASTLGDFHYQAKFYEAKRRLPESDSRLESRSLRG